MLGLGVMLIADLAEVDLGMVAYAFIGMLSVTLGTVVSMRLVWDVGVLRAKFLVALWSPPIFALALLLVGTLARPHSGLGWLGIVGNGIAATTAWLTFILVPRSSAPPGPA